MQVLPPKELSPYIKHYLFLENKGNDTQKLRLFSDGNTGVVFSLKSKLISGFSNYEAQNYLPSSFLYGQLNGFKDIYSGSEMSIVIVVFQPNGINQLLGITSSELRDTIITIDDIFGLEGIELQEKLSEQSTIQERLNLLNHFFKTLEAKKPISNQLIAAASLDFIIKTKGQFSLKQLVDYTGYTERHIERKFTECVGLNPKKFGNIVKIHGFLKLLKNKSEDTNLTTISYDAGFSDQSHLIREFKKHTGMTPKEYLYNAGKLTNNFIETVPAKNP
ncbi:AraC family transcriptional regulator [Flavobacterium sp. LS1R47]|jgi:AraC-like DNA-binding protein|uniref:AraC family transcriptional regulator n=1 Tax=Flavobacterium frigoritolerans TaxID=2987686 RepID=A0A9X3C272_9FLAO|nr:AraC family transcriptional regulator [Flavobacterium frigoritolerans]MCV9933716.1 AraC family transcriptional regulator [Flavobacterium frigoritolerans]